MELVFVPATKMLRKGDAWFNQIILCWMRICQDEIGTILMPVCSAKADIIYYFAVGWYLMKFFLLLLRTWLLDLLFFTSFASALHLSCRPDERMLDATVCSQVTMPAQTSTELVGNGIPFPKCSTIEGLFTFREKSHHLQRAVRSSCTHISDTSLTLTFRVKKNTKFIGKRVNLEAGLSVLRKSNTDLSIGSKTFELTWHGKRKLRTEISLELNHTSCGWLDDAREGEQLKLVVRLADDPVQRSMVCLPVKLLKTPLLLNVSYSARPDSSPSLPMEEERPELVACRRRDFTVQGSLLRHLPIFLPNDTILSPIEINIGSCSGHCLYPLSSSLSVLSSPRALFQSLINAHDDDSHLPDPACIPVSYRSFDVTVLTESGEKQKHRIEDIAICECSCR